MPLATAFAIFFLIWWVVLFAVLPWGHQEPTRTRRYCPGHRSRCSYRSQGRMELLWTTVVAIAIYAACYFVYAEHWITINGLMSAFQKD